MAKLIPSMIIIKTALRRHKPIARILPLKTHKYTTRERISGQENVQQN